MSIEHADLGEGTTHHGTPDECGCWSRLVARLIRERDEARALAEKYLGERVPRSDVKRARREGAEAMREAAARIAARTECRLTAAEHIRALPLPGDDR